MKKKTTLSIAAAAVVAAIAICMLPSRKENHSVEWTTMGTVASFHTRRAEDLDKAAIVMAAFADIELLANAHNPESELSRLASLDDDAGLIASVSEIMRPCYVAAFDMRDKTGGAFNPRWKGPGTLDLGAIAKGYAVDVAAERVGPCDALINLGGNLKALGGEWKVGILGAAANDVFTLKQNEACATSADYYRPDHIKNAITGQNPENGTYSVSIFHPTSAMTADALSTVMFILGREKGDEFLKTNYPEAVPFWIDEKK